MLLSAVSVLVVAQSISEIPEGLMNNPVYIYIIFKMTRFEKVCTEEGYRLFGIVSTNSPAQYKT